MRSAILLAALVSTGCSTRVLTKPTPVEIVHRELVSIPRELTTPAVIPDRPDDTVRSYVVQAESCTRELVAANERFAAIGAVSGKPSD